LGNGDCGRLQKGAYGSKTSGTPPNLPNYHSQSLSMKRRALEGRAMKSKQKDRRILRRER
jgi:hypothetical protein